MEYVQVSLAKLNWDFFFSFISIYRKLGKRSFFIFDFFSRRIKSVVQLIMDVQVLAL